MRLTTTYIILFMIIGFASASVNSKPLGNDIDIKRISSKHVIITSATIIRANGGVSIIGRLKQRYATDSRRLPGHIDVDILNAEGRVIYKTKSGYKNVSLLRVNRNFKYEYYVAIPIILTEEDTIRLSFHEKG